MTEFLREFFIFKVSSLTPRGCRAYFEGKFVKMRRRKKMRRRQARAGECMASQFDSSLPPLIHLHNSIHPPPRPPHNSTMIYCCLSTCLFSLTCSLSLSLLLSCSLSLVVLSCSLSLSCSLALLLSLSISCSLDLIYNVYNVTITQNTRFLWKASYFLT